MKMIRNFYFAFFFVGLGYIFLSLPQLILFNPFWIQIAFILMDVSFLISVLLFGSVSTDMSDESPRFKKPLVLIVFFWTSFYVLLSIIFFSSATPLKTDSTIYFWQSGTTWLQGITRGVIIAIALIMSTLGFSWAKEIFLERKLFWRSFFGSLGILMVAIAGFILWFFPFFYFSPFLLVFSGCFGLLGFLTSWIGTSWIKGKGIVFRPVRKKFVKKIT